MDAYENLGSSTGKNRVLRPGLPPQLGFNETALRQELQACRLELKRMRQQLDEASSLISCIATNATEGIIVTDAHGIIQSVNPAFERSTGYSAAEAIGHTPALFRSGRHDKAFYQEMWRTLKAHGQWQGEVWNRNKGGEIYPEWLNIVAIRDNKQKMTHHVGIFSDIHTQESILERLHYLANYDGLTGLPNRRLFLDRLSVHLAHARRDGHMLAVMFVDLDRFKEINDTHGHRTGDGLLVAVAERLKGCLREGDTFARLGGDEFTAILPVVTHVDDAVNVAQKILGCCVSPLIVDGKELCVSASIGIGLFPNDGDDADSLLHHADVAMYEIKATGRNGYLLYSSGMAICPLAGEAAARR